MPDPRVAGPRRGSRFHQVRWNGTAEATLDVKSRDESRASIDEKNLDAKIETERPLNTQGPCSDSACGRQHEGVVSLVPSDAAAPGTAVNRQVETVQDDHIRHLNKRSSDDCRTHEGRQLKGKGTMVARQHGDTTQQELTTCEKSDSTPLETRPHARKWCPLGSGISVSHGIV